MRISNRIRLGLCLVVMTTLHAWAEPVTNSAGNVQIEMPDGWHTSDDATTADIRIETTGAVFEVYSEAKIDFDNVDSLQAYAEVTLRQLAKASKLGNRQVSGPRSYKLGDRDALEYKITGSIDSRKWVFVYTFLESSRWNHVVGGTSPSLFDKMRPVFDAIARSFRDTAQAKKK